MPDLAFYDVGTTAGGPSRWLIHAPRRVLRRLLRPFFYRLREILESLCARLDAAEQADLALRTELTRLNAAQEALADSLRSSIALGWDHVALARRLAVLEDRVELLTRLAEADLPAADAVIEIESAPIAEHGPHFRVG